MEFLLLLALPLLALVFGTDTSSDDPDDTEGLTVEGDEGDDSLVGGNGDDLLLGNAGRDTLLGGAGDDTLRGSFGNDGVDGGAGNDVANGGEGNDAVFGYFGDDTLDGGRGNDVVLGEEGDDLIHLGAGNDINWVDDETSVYGFEHGQLGDDTLYGDEGNDIVWDYLGSNVQDGGAGNDLVIGTDIRLDGGPATAHVSDVVSGGAGDDRVLGDDGDTLTGGSGNDSFFARADRDDHQAVVVTDYDGNLDALTLEVDDDLANSANWSLFSTTNAQTGDVTLGVQHNTDPDQTITVAVLTNPANFAISQVTIMMA